MEEWKTIEGFEYYQVSDQGRARSLGRIDSLGRVIKGKILRPIDAGNGYLRVGLYKDGKHKLVSVHRLVWETFNGEIHEGMQVNHINEDKTDNRLCNLNLMSSKENCNFGTRNSKIANSLSKPVVGIDEQGNVVVAFPSTNEAERNGYLHNAVSACCLGKWKKYKGLIWRYT